MKHFLLMSLLLTHTFITTASDNQNGAPISFAISNAPVNKIQTDKNLINNGTFSTNKKSWADVSVKEQRGKGDQFLTVMKNHKKPYESFLRINSLNAEKYIAMLQSVGIQDKSLYEISYKYRINKIYNENTGRFGVEIKVYDHDKDIIQLSYPTGCRQLSEWTTTSTYVFAPVDSQRLNLKFFCYGAQADVTDVKIEKVTFDKTKALQKLNNVLEQYGSPFSSVSTQLPVIEAAKQHGFCIFATAPEELVVQDRNLKDKRTLSILRSFGSKGEKINLNVHVLAHKKLTVGKIESTDLQNGENIIPAQNITFKRIGFIMKHKMYVWPDKQRLLPIPLEDWTPIFLDKSLGSIWIDVKIPENSKAGIYKSTLTLKTDSGNIKLPMEIKVFNVKLPEKCSKLVGTYYPSRAKKTMWLQHKDMNYQDYVNVFKDMKSHGNEAVVIDPTIKFKLKNGKIDIDFEHAAMLLKAITEAEMNGPIVLRTRLLELAAITGSKDADYRGIGNGSSLLENEKYKEALKKYIQLIYKYLPPGKGPEVIFTDMDEIAKRPKNVSYTWKNLFIPLKKMYPKQKVFLTVSLLREEMNDIIDETLDVKCFGGQCVDIYMLENGNNFQSLEASQSDNGKDELWIYYNRGILFQKLAKFQRLMNGIWLWHTPFKGNLPWAYQDFSGNPYTYKETVRQRALNYTYPRKGKAPLSTKSWEAMARGINDMKYLDLIKGIAESKQPKTENARIFLKSLDDYLAACHKTLVMLDNQTSSKMITKITWTMACIATPKENK
jgi:hypothetical protein